MVFTKDVIRAAIARFSASAWAGLALVTPGIRPEGAVPDDQRRTQTIGAALAGGADYLVVGRPVTRAPDPAAALAACLTEARAARRPTILGTERG